MLQTAESQVELGPRERQPCREPPELHAAARHRRRRRHRARRRARRSGRGRAAWSCRSRAKARATPCSTCRRRSRTARHATPTVTVALVDDPNITATGKVREVSPRADPVTGTFAVRVQLIGPAAVDASRQHGHGPRQARRRADDPDPGRRPDARRRRYSGVGVRLRGRHRRRAQHHRAGSNETTVQVASGLNPGDVVVTAGVQALRPGQKVRPLETPQS